MVCQGIQRSEVLLRLATENTTMDGLMCRGIHRSEVTPRLARLLYQGIHRSEV